MSTPLLIGLDLGTTSTKACAFDRAGNMVEECAVAYELLHPAAGAAVQDAAEILAAAEQALTNLLAALDRPAGPIGISCAMHGLLLLDEDFQPLGPVITYADVRAQTVMDDFSPAQRRELRTATGTPVHPMSPLVKLRWLRREDPDRFGKAAYFGDLKSYLVANWTNDGLLLDKQLASATGLWSRAENDWHLPALEMALDGEETNRLPRVVDPRRQLRWKPAVAERIGAADLPLVIGGSDGCLANLGSELLEPGEVAITVGTSAAVRVTHRGQRANGEHRLFDYVLYDDLRVLGGATNNGGKAIEWVYDLLRGHFDDIGDLVTQALAAEETDIEFRPFLFGERAPIWDPAATASLTGLRGHHAAVDLARAVVLGMTRNLLEILRQVEAATCPANRLHLSGGMTRSDAWVRLVEELSGRPATVVDTPQASAHGAALIAEMACSEEGAGKAKG